MMLEFKHIFKSVRIGVRSWIGSGPPGRQFSSMVISTCDSYRLTFPGCHSITITLP